MKQLFRKLKPQQAIYDLPPSELDEQAWSDADNIYFRGQGSIRVEGYSDIANPTLLNEPFWNGYIRTLDKINMWIYAGENKIAATDFLNHYDITPLGLTGAEPQDYVGGQLNSLMMLTNNRDAPVYWDGVINNPMQPLPDWPANTTCGFIRGYRYNAIAGNITANGVNYENQFYWSSSVAPGSPPTSWTPLPSNDAGDNILASTQGPLIDGAHLRDYFVLAKNHSLYVMRYVGGNFVFNVAELTNHVGALSANCMVEYNSELYIFGDGDIIKTDGSTIVSISEQRVTNQIFNEINQTWKNRAFAVVYSAKKQIWFCYPAGGSIIANRAAIYSVEDDKWGYRDIPNLYHAAPGVASNLQVPETWEGDTQAWELDTQIWNESGVREIADSVLMGSGDDTGHLYGVDFSKTANGELIESVLTKESMDLGEYALIKLVTGIVLNVNGTSGDTLQVRVGTQLRDVDDISWGQPVTFTIGVDELVNITLKGRLISVEIRALTGEQWRCYGMQIKYQLEGLY